MSSSDLITIKNNFTSELKDAFYGKKTSLPFIKHDVPSVCLVKEDELFQVLVIGGSICKKAFVKKQGDDLRIIKNSQKDQPLFEDKETFLSFVNSELDENISVLSLNFAYPLTPVVTDGRLQGILQSGKKENSFAGLVGKNICSEIEAYVEKKRSKKIQVTAANDTICLLLSGLSQLSWDEISCGVVGTGLNFALFLDKNTLVNLEAANFDKFTSSTEGIEIDNQSSDPKKALFEKEVSGAYLYKKFNIAIKNQKLPVMTIDETKELSILSQETYSPYAETAKQTLHTSAELVATQIAGISEFLDRDVTFIMEGSLFWEGFEYKTHLEQTLEKIHRGKTISFRHIHNSYIVGAAQLACPRI